MRGGATFALALSMWGCAVDPRELQPAIGDTGGVGAFGGGGAVGTSGEPGGAAGSWPATKGLVNGCADLDTDGIADCEATLLGNPSFPEDVDAWTPEGATTLTWAPKNALSDGPSGSAQLSANTVRASAAQCARLSGGGLVIAYASAFVEASGDSDDSARAVLEAALFASPDCSGESHGHFETPPSAVLAEWTTIHAGAPSSSDTRSASLALVGAKAASAAQVTVYFDNVMLKEQAP